MDTGNPTPFDGRLTPGASRALPHGGASACPVAIRVDAFGMFVCVGPVRQYRITREATRGRYATDGSARRFIRRALPIGAACRVVCYVEQCRVRRWQHGATVPAQQIVRYDPHRVEHAPARFAVRPATAPPSGRVVPLRSRRRVRPRSLYYAHRVSVLSVTADVCILCWGR